MSKKRFRTATLALGAMVALATAGHAAPAGPFAAACAGSDPAMLVHVTGFKQRAGTIRVQSYGGDPDHYFDKGSYLRRIEVPVPQAGPLDVCVPVPAPGQYAVAVYHLAPSGKKQGGGTSGNPHMSLFSLLMKSKPSPDQVAVGVGHGIRVVPITLNYVSGGSFGPVSAG